LTDRLIIQCFMSCSRIFHLYGYVNISGEGLQNLGLCSALRAFEQGGIFIVPHLLWHRTFVVSGLIRRTDPFSCLLRHTRACNRPILTHILPDSLRSSSMRYEQCKTTYRQENSTSILFPQWSCRTGHMSGEYGIPFVWGWSQNRNTRHYT
jgi:hypothetical protein